MSMSVEQATRAAPAPLLLAKQVRQRSLWAQAWSAFRRDRVAVVAAVVIALAALAAIFAPLTVRLYRSRS